MDDLSEREQIERIRQWWRENGWYIVGGVVLGALLLTGWNQYQAYQQRQAEQAAATYDDLADAVQRGNEGTAADLLAALRSDYPSSPYAAQGGLLIASLHLRQNNPGQAAEILREVMGSAPDRDMALVARLRLARVLAYLEDYDEALQVLAVSEPGQFAARFNEIRGDVHAATGDADTARDAYMQALVAPGAEVLDRNILQMKLNDLAVADAMPPPGDFPLPDDLPQPGDPPLPGEVPPVGDPVPGDPAGQAPAPGGTPGAPGTPGVPELPDDTQTPAPGGAQETG